MPGWLRRTPSPRIEQRSRVSNALADYPPYTPSAWDDDPDTIGHATYTEFFLENRERRLEALRKFLAKFNVALTLDDDGVMAVSAWCPLNADLLVDGLETDAVWSAYHQFAAAWAGPLLGLNAIFDLGIYCGECVLLRNRKLKWQPLRGPDHYVQHPILGQKYQRSFDPIGWMYITCINIYNVNTRRFDRGRGESTKQDYLCRLIHSQSTA